MNDTKRMLLKAVKLEEYFKDYTRSEQAKKEVIAKFQAVWGVSMADHFLGKYDNADSLIWALDSDNLEKFIKNF